MLRTIDFQTEYRSSRAHIAEEFLVPALQVATRYDRAVGYFRSSVYWTLERGLRPFVERGGRIRIVCSPEMNRDDVAAMETAYLSRREASERALLREIDRLISQPDVERHLEVFATLMRFSVLDLRVATYTAGAGIFHEKIGVLSDEGGDSVSFKGSSNESWSGWHPEGNLESIEVFTSWQDDREAGRVLGHALYLDELWRGNEPGVDVADLPSAVREHILTFATDDLDRVLGHRKSPPRLRPSVSRLEPLEHQAETLRSWLAAGKRGVVKHATGSGKTITGILALREHLETGGAALVLVPSRLLLYQWAEEIGRHIPEAAVLLAGDGHEGWRGSDLPAFTMEMEGEPRIVLAINDTARSADFLRGVDGGEHLMVLGDEVHRLGASSTRSIMGIDAGARMGLSATPERAGDPSGTEVIFDYFGQVLAPIVTLKDAIAAKRLVEYEYNVHTVDLDEEEVAEWTSYSKRIAMAIGGAPSTDGVPEAARVLMIQRSKVMKKAAEKAPLAASILEESFEPGQRWLVYCEDTDQLELLTDLLRRREISVMRYHSGMSGPQRQATLDWLRSEGGIVLSIRCLDEGVDIPAVSHALVIASSRNPREFVQRRGRVLRAANDKPFATIHDVIVLPPTVDDNDEPSRVSRQIAASELGRAATFARDAMNQASIAELERALIDLGFSAEEVATMGVEDDPGADE